MAITRETLDTLTRESRRPRWLQAALAFTRRRPLGTIGAFIILVMAIVGLGAPWVAPFDPLTTDYGAMIAPPSLGHWLGTDAYGRDVLSRILYGSRTALIVGFGASVLGATLGALIGVASAYFGGKIDLVIERINDVLISFPLIILALSVVAILGTGVQNVILAIAVPMIPRCARVVRASALAVR
ncbi:MAG TPA: ABC transporter permease, partial [Burkholderiales bacterium]|nr:ABC transporter permease [Burkholderiales bacterium]